jgi:hypothetical protein
MRETISQDLNDLANFLNLKLTKKSAKFIFEDPTKSGPSVQGAKFMRSHGGPLPDLVKAQSDISFFLMCLQPEVYEDVRPQRDSTQTQATIDEFSKKYAAQNRKMIADFKADPGHFLYGLVDAVNHADHAAQWVLQESPPTKNWNISIRDSRWLLKKYPYGGRGTVFHWVARILERGELSKLRCCRVCNRFFIPNRPQQKYCREKCKIFYDKRLAASRKADWRADKASKQQQKTDLQEKNKMLQYLQSPESLKIFPGGPSQTHTARKELLKLLSISSTVDDFKRVCDPQIVRSILSHTAYRT